MFTEILRIRPQLDNASAARMEASLTGRFTRVAKRFGAGLKNIMKGTILGISLGLLAKLLNPLGELEDKIKRLLDQGRDLTDMADRFGTTPDKLVRLQALGQSMGVSPEELKDLMTKYAESVETARKKIERGEELGNLEAVGQFATNMPDLAEGFFLFIQKLKDLGKGEPTQEQVNFLRDSFKLRAGAQEKLIKGQPISDEERAALIRAQNFEMTSGGTKAARSAQEAVFGSALYGKQRRFIETDFNQQIKKVGKLPTSQEINQAAGKTDELNSFKGLIEMKSDLADFVRASSKMNKEMLYSFEQLRMRDEKKLTDDLDRTKQMMEMANMIKDLMDVVKDLTYWIMQGVVYLKQLVNGWLPKLTESRFWRYFAVMGRGKK